MKMDKILLIGFRASGKSSVGKELARKLGMKFVDLDEEIEKSLNKSIKEIVEEKGWEEFRKIEKEFLRRILGEREIVIALGGGAVLHEEEMQRLKAESFVIWLYATPEVVFERIVKDEKSSSQRPFLTGLSLKEEIEKVFSERFSLYQKFSHIKIDTSSEPLEIVVKKVLKVLKGGVGDVKGDCECH